MPQFDEQQIGFIGGESVAWPQEGQPHYGEHFRHLRRAVEAIRAEVRESDAALARIEDNRDLTEEGRTRQLSDLGLGVIGRIDAHQTLRAARERAERRVAILDMEMQAHAMQPETAADIALASEIRATLRPMSGPERMRFIQTNIGTPAVANALATGPAFLSGLSETEAAEVRGMIAERLYQPQAEEKAAITRALRQLDASRVRAHTLVASRARLERNVHDEWAPRGQRVPPARPTAA